MKNELEVMAMSEKQIKKKMILDILGEIDYDTAKNYLKATAEEPEYVKENMQKLVIIVQKHIKKANHKRK